MAKADETRDSVSDALHLYWTERNAAFTAARKFLGIGEVDARALVYLAAHPGTRPGDLGEFLGITSAGVTTLADRLILRQVIRRDNDEDDRRAVRLTAIVDLAREPWSALRRFDEELAAVSALREGTGDAARLIVEIVEAAAAAAASASR